MQWSDELFSTYDFDGVGTIDLEELTALMQNHDAEVTEQMLVRTLIDAGAGAIRRRAWNNLCSRSKG